jgi:hypothetical protein
MTSNDELSNEEQHASIEKELMLAIKAAEKTGDPEIIGFVRSLQERFETEGPAVAQEANAQLERVQKLVGEVGGATSPDEPLGEQTE